VYLSSIGKNAFGILVFVGSILAIANICLNAMRGNLIRFMALSAGRGKYNEVGVHFCAVRILLLAYFLISALILIVLSAAQYAEHSNDTFENINFTLVVALSALHLLVQAVFNAEYFLLSALHRQALGNFYFTLGFILFFLLVTPWLYLGGGVEGVVTLQLMSSVIITTLAIHSRHAKLTRIPRRTDWYRLPEAARRYLGADGQVFLKYAIIVAILQGDILLVALLGGPQAAADFAIIWRIAEVVLLLLWRFADSLQPDILRLEAQQNFIAIRQIYLRGMPVILCLSLLAGLAYAVAGPYVVELWVGSAVVSEPGYAFWAIGGAIFWLGIARYSTIFPSSLARLKGLLRITLVELICRLTLVAALFGSMGYLANPVAINLVHMLGVGWAYMAVTRRITSDIRRSS
jgi:O-antigen/teichoic acid export membrane protein